MPTVTVPLDKASEASLQSLQERGYGSNKAAIIRKALHQAEEEALLNDLLIAEQEIKAGKTITGDLKNLLA